MFMYVYVVYVCVCVCCMYLCVCVYACMGVCVYVCVCEEGGILKTTAAAERERNSQQSSLLFSRGMRCSGIYMLAVIYGGRLSPLSLSFSLSFSPLSCVPLLLFISSSWCQKCCLKPMETVGLWPSPLPLRTCCVSLWKT